MPPSDKLFFKNAPRFSLRGIIEIPAEIREEAAKLNAGPRQYPQNLEEIMKVEVPPHWPQWPKENALREALVLALQSMDMAAVKVEVNKLADMNKEEKVQIIGELRAAFKKFRAAGDTFLTTHIGHCMGRHCNFFCKGYSFVGNKSGMYCDLIIKIKDDVAQEINECVHFKNHDVDLRKERRVMLDENRIPF
ncbi:MAG: hypothetical protein IT270_15210 [Saprospiraceae bacterium]|nr:hypothetical protein [Saprospiraceae bacterium]